MKLRAILRIVLLAAFGALLATATTGAAAAESRVDFRHPARQYQRAPSDLNIYVEQSLARGDKTLATDARQKLERNLREVFDLLPARAAMRLRPIRFYLMWGPDAPEGGRRSGMSYIRDNEPRNHPNLDPRWAHVIVVYSAKNLMYLDALWTKKALMHELAHAWHIINWPEKYPPINNAYIAARTAGLYRNVKDYKGKLIADAYANRNPLEYFAELSTMFFVGANYFPFDREGLEQYDKSGGMMVRQLWGL